MADYNFTSGAGKPEQGGVRGFVRGVADAYNRAGQLSQERRVPNNDLRRQAIIQDLEHTRWVMHERAYSMQLQTKAREGAAKLNAIMAEGLGPNADPDMILRKLYEVGSQYAIPPEQFDGLIQSVQTMKNRRELASKMNQELGGGYRLMPSYDDQGNMSVSPRKVSPEISNEMQKIEDYNTLLRKAEEARARGDTAEYQSRMKNVAQMERQMKGNVQAVGMLNGNMLQVSGGADDVNSVIGSMTKPTVSTMTEAQRFNISAAGSMEMMNKLESMMTSDYVGVRGNLGEIVVDRALAQLDPSLAEGERIDARQLMKTLGENLLSVLSADSGGRLSDQDVRRIKQFTDISGWNVSLPQAQRQLAVLKDIMRMYARNKAERIGEPIPDFALSLDEVKARYDKQIEAIRTALSDGRITPEQAQAEADSAWDRSATTINRYHK